MTDAERELEIAGSLMRNAAATALLSQEKLRELGLIEGVLIPEIARDCARYDAASNAVGRERERLAKSLRRSVLDLSEGAEFRDE